MENEYNSPKLCHIDIETTGTNHNRHGIHQIACIIDKDGEVISQFNFNVKPHPIAEINASSLSYSGVTRQQIMQYPDMFTIRKQILEIWSNHCDITNPKDKMFLCGYNAAHFDQHFVKKWFELLGDDLAIKSYFFSPVRDTMVLAVEYLEFHKISVANYSQACVAEALGIEVDKSRLHNATYDVNISRTIYKKVNAWIQRK